MLREPQVAQVTGLGRSTRYELELRGEFPRRRRITDSAVGWLESEIEEWLLSRERGCAAPPVAALEARGVKLAPR
jgi:prophage regulatory protein